jgi:hypothetical protein
MLRVGDMLPLAHTVLWPEFEARWQEARGAFEEVVEVSQKVINLINTRFQDLYQAHYTDWIQEMDAPLVFTHQFLFRILKAHWDPRSGQKAIVLVFDGLRTDAWDEFVRPVLEERFELIESRPGSALIPTETELSRKAIAAGKLPLEFQVGGKREINLLTAWLKDHMGISPAFTVVNDEDAAASGITVRYQSNQLEYIVFNFTDDNLHHNAQDLAFIYNHTVREIIRQDVRSVLRELPANALVFITSDHGFIPMPKEYIEVGEDVIVDPNLVKYRVVRAARGLGEADTDRFLSFDIRTLKIPVPDVARGQDPVKQVLFPQPGFLFRRTAYRQSADRFSHGGLNMAECFVPMVVMGRARLRMA